jgi:hypothetical protein
MEKLESPIPRGSRLALKEFVESIIEDPRDISRLEQLQSERPPRTSSVLDRDKHIPGSLEWQYKDVVEAPTPGYLERRAIEVRIECAIRAALTGPDFVASGRRPDSFERIFIDAREWRTLPIDLACWTVGSGKRLLTDVLVEPTPSTSDDERLYEFVLTILSKLQLGDITKPSVETLAKALEPYEVTPAMFDRAWERATKIIKDQTGMDWAKKGRRPSRR